MKEEVTKHIFYRLEKRLLDIVLSAILFILSIPFLIVFSIWIFIETGHFPVYSQKRGLVLEKNMFRLYKIRTLKGTNQKQLNSIDIFIKDGLEEFVTPLGRWLRKTGLDELPQLFNVLKGEMSLIGPRPPIPKEVEKYERWQLRRLSVKPGITCTWQIIPNRNEVVFDKWMKLDIQYIENWSLKKDLELFFKTIKTLFLGTGY